jgi:glycosyltransferase involved in cell wall biosynthesis
VLAHGGESLKYSVLAGVPSGRLAYYKIGVGGRRLTGPKGVLHRALVHRPCMVAAVSRDAAEEARSLGVLGTRLRVIPNGRDPLCYAVRSRAKHDRAVRLVFVGHLTESKRPERFIALVRMLRSQGLEVEASMAGDGPMLNEVARDGRAEGIDVLGRVGDVPALLARSDVFVFTSIAEGEGMPGVLIEAGMSGLPVVTTSVPGAADVVDDGHTGYVVPINDFEALVHAVREVVLDPELRDRLGAAARRRCTDEFGLATSVRRWHEALEELIVGQCTSST